MKIERFEDKHYDIITKWCDDRKIPILEKDFLSEFGIVVKDKDKYIAAAWLFPIMGAKISEIRFPITNPNTDKKERKNALKLLFYNLHTLANKMNYKYMFISTNHLHLQKHLIEFGYNKTDENCSHYWGRL